VEQAAPHQHPLPEPAPPNYATPAGMRREEFRAMGTTISMLLPANQVEMGAKIVRTLFFEWEQALNRSRDEKGQAE
jgi:FAD:protein FMN transferase